MSNEEEKKLEKRNIILMLLVALAFIIGILTRWDTTKTAIKESINNYFPSKDKISE